MDENKGNECLSANEGVVYVNGNIWANVTKINIDAEAETEEVNFVGDSVTYERFKGYKVSGSITIKKIDSTVSLLIADGIKTGNFPNIKLIAKQGKLNGKAERIAIDGVIFKKLTLINLEANNLIDEELPLTARTFDYLDRI